MRIFSDCLLFRRVVPANLAAALAGAACGASAQALAPPPSGVVNLSASATAEVPKDLLTITFSTTRDGSDAAAVQSQLKQALDAALGEARKVARPGQVDVRTGNFSLYPRYTPKGASNGWQGATELVVEGRDMAAIGQLSGRIGTLTIARVGYALSRELREKTEADVAAQAIAQYRAKAADVARLFGYAAYSVREVNVSANEAQPPAPVMAMRMKAMAAPAEESLPVEPGNGLVTVNVSGTVQLTK